MDQNNKVCTACGTTAQQDSVFCANCGATLPTDAAPLTPDSSWQPSMPDLDSVPQPFMSEPVGTTPAQASATVEAETVSFTPVPTAPVTTPVPAAPQAPAVPTAGTYSAQAAPTPYGQPQYSQPGYGQPAGGYTAQPGVPVQPQYAAATVAEPPKKKSPVAAIIIILLVAIGAVAAVIFFSQNKEFRIEDYKTSFVWDGSIDYIDWNDGTRGFSFTALNESKKTIAYFEGLAFFYDANGNPILDEYDTNWTWVYDEVYIRSGDKHTPANDGYWQFEDAFASAEQVWVGIYYVEFSDGTYEGINDYLDEFSQAQMWDTYDYLSELADAAIR